MKFKFTNDEFKFFIKETYMWHDNKHYDIKENNQWKFKIDSIFFFTILNER